MLERLQVSGSARIHWPVLELDGRMIWMQGVELEPEPGIEVRVTSSIQRARQRADGIQAWIRARFEPVIRLLFSSLVMYRSWGLREYNRDLLLIRADGHSLSAIKDAAYFL